MWFGVIASSVSPGVGWLVMFGLGHGRGFCAGVDLVNVAWRLLNLCVFFESYLSSVGSVL